MRKKIISLLLVLLLSAGLLPFSAFAASTDKLIALTFDDGPSGYTSTLLDGLKERGAKVTFFIVGTNAQRYPKTINRAWSEGHEICSHTYDHPQLTKLSYEGIRSQLDTTDALLDGALGWDESYMLRPPYGSYNDSVLKAVNSPCFYWSVDTRDWESRNADAAYAEFLRAAKNGSIVLMHDVYSTTVTAALRAIDTLQAEGYEFVTLSELFCRRGIELENASIYFSAYNKGYTADGIAEPVISMEMLDGEPFVSISGDTRGSVYYTLDGSAPTPLNSRLYEGPIAITDECTVTAVSVIKWNGLRSDNVSEAIAPRCERPVLSISDGKLSMSSATRDSIIFYTTDGSEPIVELERYFGEFEAEKGTSYKAACYRWDRALSETAMLTYTKGGHIFDDVAADEWCIDTVDRVIDEGLFKGVTETSFAPYSYMTRAQFISVLWRFAGCPESETEISFCDVPEDFWAHDAIAWGYGEGVICGFSESVFQPRSLITRAQLAAMLYRYCGSPAAEGDLEYYADEAEVPQAFYAPLVWAVDNGLVQGYKDDTLRPSLECTRGVAATVFLRFCDLQKAG